MKLILGFLLFLLSESLLFAGILPVGPGKTYSSLQNAASVAQPGDTILMYTATYSGGEYIEDLQGTSSAWITIKAAPGATVLYSGGSQAFQMSDPAYLSIEGLIFEEQTGNGVNIDDGGTYATPAHHIHFINCEWRSMNASGNNDELKLSGLDYFIIKDCTFKNGAAGGSLIDMVGCHNGLFENNYFENGGSNSIQAKGGSKDIIIRANHFIDGGERAINIGGSTGLQFFRPLGVLYEAANIYVYANLFKGAFAPIAYVGAINSEVVNNTIIEPDGWVVRILQETTEPGFAPSGQNSFINNIIVFGNTGKPAYNVGPNTAPETFTISNNLWYNPDNLNWAGPNSPVVDPNQILNQDPLFADIEYHLEENSPAVGAGLSVINPTSDYFGNAYSNPRSIGYAEYQISTDVNTVTLKDFDFNVYPNPAHDFIKLSSSKEGPLSITLLDITGEVILEKNFTNSIDLDIRSLNNGLYFIKSKNAYFKFIKQ